MGFLKTLSTSGFPRIRIPFHHISPKVKPSTLKWRRTKGIVSMIGLVGLALILILMVSPPIIEPRLLWNTDFVKIMNGREQEFTTTYSNLLMNHLNSRRVVNVIRQEGLGVSKQRKCKRVLPDCPLHPPHLRGKLPMNKWVTDANISIERINEHFRTIHKGIWSPRHCISRHSVAIIIPYRMRETQLHLLLRHLPRILKKQQINYSIFVVEQVLVIFVDQTGNSTFNKGTLMNAGFLTALTRPAHGVIFHCFIFHDVDLLAEDDRNLYTCPQRPRHLSVAVDELGYELPYSELAGGVFAIRTDQFLKVNGYSNSYWGWGGEDDDMGLRVKFVFGQAMRPHKEFGRYTSIWHRKQAPSLPLRVRRRLKRMTRSRFRGDGLNTVKYRLVKIEQKYQYTHIHIDVGHPPSSNQSALGEKLDKNPAYDMITPKANKDDSARAMKTKKILETRYRTMNWLKRLGSKNEHTRDSILRLILFDE